MWTRIRRRTGQSPSKQTLLRKHIFIHSFSKSAVMPTQRLRHFRHNTRSFSLTYLKNCPTNEQMTVPASCSRDGTSCTPDAACDPASALSCRGSRCSESAPQFPGAPTATRGRSRTFTSRTRIEQPHPDTRRRVEISRGSSSPLAFTCYATYHTPASPVTVALQIPRQCPVNWNEKVPDFVGDKILNRFIAYATAERLP